MRRKFVLAMSVAALALAGCSNGDDGGDDAGGKDANYLEGWAVLGKDALPISNLTSVWSNGKSGADREWLIVGGSAAGNKDGLVLELRGDTWSKHTFKGVGLLWWVHGDASGRRIAVGDGGTIIRWQSGDKTLTHQQVPSLRKAKSQLFGVWFADKAERFFLVGGNASDQTAKGLLWTVPFSAKTGDDIDAKATQEKLDGKQGLLMKVWGASNERVFTVGEEGKIWALDKGAWKLDGTIETDRFIGVTGRSENNVVAVGGLGSGVIAKRDATGWKQVAGCSTCFINGQLAAVILTEDGTTIVGGSVGYLATHKGEKTEKDLPTLDPPISELTLHGAWADSHTMVVVGGNLSNPSTAAGVVMVRGEKLPELPQ